MHNVAEKETNCWSKSLDVQQFTTYNHPHVCWTPAFVDHWNVGKCSLDHSRGSAAMPDGEQLRDPLLSKCSSSLYMLRGWERVGGVCFLDRHREFCVGGEG